MPANIAELDDTVTEIAPPFEGRQNVTFLKVTTKPKGGDARATWFGLDFEGPNGERVRSTGNFYGNPQTEKQVMANTIFYNGTIVKLARLAKVDPETVAKSASGIAGFLNSVEGSLKVSAYLKDNGFGAEASGFQVATETAE
jgi:hypothetical protein